MDKKFTLQTLGLFFIFCILVLIIGSFTGCAPDRIEATTDSGRPLGHDRFQAIKGAQYVDYFDEVVYVDTETGVQYLYVIGYSKGGLTVLVDSDGKPLIADGYGDY